MRNVEILSTIKTIGFLFFKHVDSEIVKYRQVIRRSHEISCPEIAKKQIYYIAMKLLGIKSTEEPCWNANAFIMLNHFILQNSIVHKNPMKTVYVKKIKYINMRTCIY